MSFNSGEIESIESYIKNISFNPLFSPENAGISEEKYFSNLHLLPNQFAYIINNSNGTIPMAKGFDTFLGYSDNMISLEFLFGLFHPEDAEQMTELVKRAYTFGMSRNPAIPFSVQFILSYRVRMADKSYIKILRQSTILSVDDNQKMVSTFSICTDISAIDKSNEIRYQMLGETADDFSTLNSEQNRMKLCLTPREKEILNMIAKGLATKEIAEKLHLSFLTVETQRKNMLRRYNMKNTAQMIYWANESGLI